MFKVYTKPGYELLSENNVPIGSKLLFKAKEHVKNGIGSFEDGYLIGNLIGDGFVYFNKNKPNTLQYYCILMEYDLCQTQKDFIHVAASKLNSNKKWKGWCWRKSTKGWQISLSQYPKLWNIYHGSKYINNKISNESSLEFKKGLISGYMDADGSVCIKDKRITLCSVSIENLKYIQEFLVYFGIFSRIRLHRESYFNVKIGYKVKTSYILRISGQYLKIFFEKIGFKHQRKQDLLKQVVELGTFRPIVSKMEVMRVENLI